MLFRSVRSEQALGRADHVQQIVQFRANPAENSKAKLDKQRWFIQFAIKKMSKIVEMANVVTFEFEPCPKTFAEPVEYCFHITKGVAEHSIPRSLEKWQFPIELPRLYTLDHWEQPDVNRAHIQRRHFRCDRLWGGNRRFERTIR